MPLLQDKDMCPCCFLPMEHSDKCLHCGYTENSYQTMAGCLEQGTILLGRYLVGGVLGRGGFGVTYLAYDLQEESRVAIKEYLPDTLAYRIPGNTQVMTYSGDEKQENFRLGSEKFYEEAQMIARFSGHPNIIRVQKFFYENETAYFVMEYLEGCDLRQYMEQQGGTLGYEEAVSLLVPILEALVLIHSVDILHRDISPDNIYITKSGVAKLLDFGSARQVLREQSKSLSVILKPGFAPVEQYQSHGNQGPWTDLYAFSATLYYCLTGQLPAAAMDRVEQETLLPPSSFHANLPKGIDKLMSKALALRAVNRYQTAAELRSDLLKLAAPAQANGQLSSLPKTTLTSQDVSHTTVTVLQNCKAYVLNHSKQLFMVGALVFLAVIILAVLPKPGNDFAKTPVYNGSTSNPGVVSPDPKPVPSEEIMHNQTANLNNEGFMTAMDGYIYYSGGKNLKNIYRMKADCTQAELLQTIEDYKEPYITRLTAYNGKLYFSASNRASVNDQNVKKIMCFDGDGSSLNVVATTNSVYYYFWIYNNMIYTGTPGTAFNAIPFGRCNLDGSGYEEIILDGNMEATFMLNFYKDRIYYIESDGIYTSDTDGNRFATIKTVSGNEDFWYRQFILDQYLYFERRDYDTKILYLMRMNLETNEIEEVNQTPFGQTFPGDVAQRSTRFNVYGNNIIVKTHEMDDENEIIRLQLISPDGKLPAKTLATLPAQGQYGNLADGGLYVFNDSAYIRVYWENGENDILRIPLDGSGTAEYIPMPEV